MEKYEFLDEIDLESLPPEAALAGYETDYQDLDIRKVDKDYNSKKAEKYDAEHWAAWKSLRDMESEPILGKKYPVCFTTV